MLTVMQGDITTFLGDCIVNAANTTMLGGGGVDGAIHKAAGLGLYKECFSIMSARKFKKCEVGEPIITKGYKLSCKYVIHVAGPVWHDGKVGEAEMLEKAYREVLKLAKEQQIKSIAFPSISTGIYGYPLEQAVPLAISVMREYADEMDITVYCYDKDTYSHYSQVYENIPALDVRTTI